MNKRDLMYVTALNPCKDHPKGFRIPKSEGAPLYCPNCFPEATRIFGGVDKFPTWVDVELTIFVDKQNSNYIVHAHGACGYRHRVQVESNTSFYTRKAQERQAKQAAQKPQFGVPSHQVQQGFTPPVTKTCGKVKEDGSLCGAPLPADRAKYCYVCWPQGKKSKAKEAAKVAKEPAHSKVPVGY